MEGSYEYSSEPLVSLKGVEPLTSRLTTIQWVPATLSLGVKRPEREADHSSPPSAEVKELMELHLHSPNTPSWRCAHLKAQGQL
jgi:hypothetical protein